MRLIDRYLLREWLFPFVYCLTGFMILWIAFDLIGELDEFKDAMEFADRRGVPYYFYASY